MYNQIDSNKRKSIILIILFAVIVLALGWVIGRMTGYGYGGLILAAIISIFMSLVGYYSGDKIALWSAGAKPIKKEDNPYIYRLVENLCIASGVPTPKIYLIPDQSMNAFATGRKPETASIALTTGIVEKLENEELEGVIAHELSHVKNYDIRLMTLVGILVGIIVLLSDWFSRSLFFGGNRDRNNKMNPIVAVVGIVLIILSPVFAEIIKLAISRKREFLADASGALLTRYPEGLARALEKIGAQSAPLQHANNATAHLYIASPFGAKAGRGLVKLFSTHPPIEERVRALRSMT